MAEFDPLNQGITGRQAYRLDIPGTASAAALSVVSFTATEKMGEPNVVHIELTHPKQLPRADYLNRDAVFSIVADDGTVRRLSGFIARFSTVQTAKDFVKYEIELKSHLARLKAVTRNRIFQHGSTPDILKATLQGHGMRDHQFRFRLRRSYPQHAFRMQYGMTDFDYGHTRPGGRAVGGAASARSGHRPAGRVRGREQRARVAVRARVRNGRGIARCAERHGHH